MPGHLTKTITLVGLTLATRAHAGAWRPLGDKSHPNCGQDSCIVKQGAIAFEVGMQTEDRDDLTYLKRITIKNRSNGKTQEFDTESVNAAKRGGGFEIFEVHLQDPSVTDLALHAFDSAKAGPSFYYYLYDKKTREFVASDSTAPKLVYDAKSKGLKTDVQGVAFKIVDHKLTEK